MILSEVFPEALTPFLFYAPVGETGKIGLFEVLLNGCRAEAVLLAVVN